MIQRLPARAEVLLCLSESPRPIHAREIAVRLGVQDGDYADLLALLDRLCLDGAARRLAGSRYRAHAPPRVERWEGVLTMNPRGFGFVAAAGKEDVYVARDGVGGAMHGDRVLVVATARSIRGTEGRIEGICQRRSPCVVGVVHSRGRNTWLEPDDLRIRGPMVLTGAEPRKHDGQAAVVRITRFPEWADENPEAELTRVLGPPG
ncbi:ribonuclease R, partial [Myxococcota bacterium]